jgi:ferredoxin
MTNFCTIAFPSTDFSPIILPCHENLSEHLTVHNSPVLFGCRTGICGTCLVEVVGAIPPPQPEEREILENLAPHHPLARLACQLELAGDIEIVALK